MNSPSLPRLSLTHHVLLAPLAVIGLLVVLLVLLLPQLAEIRRQNETVRDWGYAIEHLEIAMGAGRRLDGIAAEMPHVAGERRGELEFSYLEQSGLYTGNALHPALIEKLTPETANFLTQQEAAIRYREGVDMHASRVALAASMARLQALDGWLWAQKRLAYAEYYKNVKDMTPRLINMSLAVLVLCIVAGVGLVSWSMVRINRRLRILTQGARAICAGEQASLPAPSARNDELDELAVCLSSMTHRLINVVGAEKVIEGAEDERRRIAMDLHDQTLSELTALARDLRDLQSRPPGDANEWDRRLRQLAGALQEASDNVRAIMDDLHPQTLDMLGLEAALRAYLKKHTGQAGCPVCELYVDTLAESALNAQQRLMLYRIALEAIHNVMRHAHCNRCEVELRQAGGCVMLSVEDNGSGFSPQQPLHGRGLASMRERAKTLGAEVQWLPARFSSGTRFQLRLAVDGATTQAAVLPVPQHG